MLLSLQKYLRLLTLNYIRKNNSIADVRLGSKYASVLKGYTFQKSSVNLCWFSKGICYVNFRVKYAIIWVLFIQNKKSQPFIRADWVTKTGMRKSSLKRESYLDFYFLRDERRIMISFTDENCSK